MKRWRRLAWLLLLVPVAAGLWRLRFDSEVLNLLPQDVPAVEGLLLQQRNFANRRELIVTVSNPSAREAESAARLLAEGFRGQPDLVKRAVWQPPWLERREEAAGFLAWLWLNEPPEKFNELARRLAPDQRVATATAAREELATSMSPMEMARLGHDPFGFSRVGGGLGEGAEASWFASEDGTFRLLFVEPPRAPKDFKEWSLWLAEVRRSAAKTASAPHWPEGTKLDWTGPPAFLVETAESMAREMESSASGTALVIVLLFWWAHRRWAPLGWLVICLGLALVATLGIGGLLYGTLNVVSFGFAAILLGLGVDFALVLYQELLEHPGLSAEEVRRRAGGGIVWSAASTALAFGLLNFGGLPGLGQLGTLVGCGVVIAALIMLFVFLPLAGRTARPSVGKASSSSRWSVSPRWIRRLSLVLLAGAALVAWRSWPGLDHSTEPLGQRHSGARRAALEIERRLAGGGESTWILARGGSVPEVGRKLDRLNDELSAAVRQGLIESYDLPGALWPKPERQQENLRQARKLAEDADGLAAAVQEAGFTPEAAVLGQSVLQNWGRLALDDGVIWPGGDGAAWLMERVAARAGPAWLALGRVQGAKPGWGLRESDAFTADWRGLAEVLLARVKTRVVLLAAGVLAALLVCLRLAFGDWRDVALSLATLCFALLLLSAVMALLGWQWNLLNLVALPLLLGSAEDYTIHVQLALRRHGGDVAALRAGTGRALFLCAATTVAGFGSLAFSSNAGLASLGQVCAAGIAASYFTALYLLPAWHYTVLRKH